MEVLTFENQGTNTYLVCNLTECEIDTMSLGMITNNRIPGFAPALYTQQDEQKYMKYNVTSKVALRQFLSGTVRKKQLLGVLTGIVTAFRAAEEYMLDADSILLDLDYIFADVTTCKAEVICLPVLDDSERTHDIGTFFKTIMFTTQFDANENCDYVARIMNYLNGTPSFSWMDFANLLNELENMTVILSKNPPVEQQTVQSVPQQQVQQPVPQMQPQIQQPVPQPQPQIQPSVPPKAAESFGVQIPKKQDDAVPPQRNLQKPVSGEPQADEEKISLFYLLQHYNKENAEKYKAQKEAGKSKGKQPKQPKQPKPAKNSKADKTFVQPQMPVPGSEQPAISQPVNPQPVVSQPVIPQPAISQPVIPQPAVSQPVNPQPVVSQPVNGGTGAANFGETTILNQAKAGETTVLSRLQQPQPVKSPYLVRAKNHERIALNRPVFRIGKEKSFVDYFIGDNTAVSRSHANFLVREEYCYVMDTNSTNHTFVNGEMIASSQEILLQDGDKVSLADEEFEFKMM